MQIDVSHFHVDPNGIWSYGWFFVLLVSVFPLRIPKVARLLWWYALISALVLVQWPAIFYGNDTIAFQASAGQTLAVILILPLAAVATPDIVFLNLANALAVVEIFCVWFFHRGVMGWQSFDNSLVALMVPFLDPWIAAFGVVTCLLHHGTTALTILLAELCVFHWRKIRWFLPFLGFAAFKFRHPLLEGSHSRAIEWWHMMWYWWQSGWIHRIFGFGAGSFIWTSIILTKDFHREVFFQMHSDWFQILFEYGFIGFLLSVALLFHALWIVKDKKTKAALIGGAVFMLTYHPLHYAASAFVVAWILARTFSCKSSSR